jgi:hypothetical protein
MSRRDDDKALADHMAHDRLKDKRRKPKPGKVLAAAAEKETDEG